MFVAVQQQHILWLHHNTATRASFLQLVSHRASSLEKHSSVVGKISTLLLPSLLASRHFMTDDPTSRSTYFHCVVRAQALWNCGTLQCRQLLSPVVKGNWSRRPFFYSDQWRRYMSAICQLKAKWKSSWFEEVIHLSLTQPLENTSQVRNSQIKFFRVSQ